MSEINSVCISARNDYLVSGADDEKVILWALPSGRMIQELEGH